MMTKNNHLITQINNAIVHSNTNESLQFIVCEVANKFVASVFVCNSKGDILFCNEQNIQQQKQQEKQQLNKLIAQNALNIPYANENLCLYENFVNVYPLILNLKHLGALVIYKNTTFEQFDEYDNVFIQYITTVCALYLQQLQSSETTQTISQTAIVKQSLASLSYSEVVAACLIVDALNASEGIIVASNIAKSGKVTRSAIVNTLRKLESADILESQSLGVKGTYINIKNLTFIKEVNKLKKL